MEKLNETYQIFIKTRLHSNEPWSPSEIELLFNLHNHHVNPDNPKYGQHCSSCVQTVLDSVRSTYPSI